MNRKYVRVYGPDLKVGDILYDIPFKGVGTVYNINKSLCPAIRVVRIDIGSGTIQCKPLNDLAKEYFFIDANGYVHLYYTFKRELYREESETIQPIKHIKKVAL